MSVCPSASRSLSVSLRGCVHSCMCAHTKDSQLKRLESLNNN